MTLKYNSAGDTQWVRRYWGGVNATQNQPAGISLDRFNNIYITGAAYYTPSGDDYVTIKYISDGTQQWAATYNGPLTNSNDGANDLVIDSSYNLYVTGISSRQNQPEILIDAATLKYNLPIGIIHNNNELPLAFKLYQNYPNPFNGNTIINYEIPVKGHIRLDIYNSLGQIVKTLVNSEQAASYYTIILNAENLSSGVYFYRITAQSNGQISKTFFETRKIIIIK